jgi:hypothetical protein
VQLKPIILAEVFRRKEFSICLIMFLLFVAIGNPGRRLSPLPMRLADAATSYSADSGPKKAAWNTLVVAEWEAAPAGP